MRKFRGMVVTERVHRVYGFGFTGSGSGFRVSGCNQSNLRLLILSFEFWVLSFWSRVSVFGFRIADFEVKVSGSRFLVPGFG